MKQNKYHRRQGINANTIICDTCNVRIPANHPKLYCNLCDEFKHARCQKLSKLEATEIVNSSVDWICFACISSILPVDAHSQIKKEGTLNTVPKYKQKCGACTGYSYSPKNVVECDWCFSKCHKKCVKGTLGCLKCCEIMIPAYKINIWDLFDEPNLANNAFFNPYDSKKLASDIGDAIDNEIEQNCAWQEVLEFLTKCKYR